MRVATGACLALLTLLSPARSAEVTQAEIARLILQLNDPDYDKQKEANQRLEQIGEPARAALLDAVKRHTDQDVREHARAVLGRLVAAKVSRLIKQLGADTECGKAAEKELRKIITTRGADEQQMERKEADARLRRFLATKLDAPTRARARRVLTAGTDQEEVRARIKRLADPDDDRRHNAFVAMKVAGWAAMDELEKALKSEDKLVRAQAKKLVALITGKSE